MSSDWRYHVHNIGFLTNSWKQYGFSSSDNLSKGKWNQNFTVSERCSVSHRLWQYLSPRCMQKRVPHLWQFIKFTNFLTWRHHRQHYECMTHNIRTYKPAKYCLCGTSPSQSKHLDKHHDADLIHLYITPSHYNHCAHLSEDNELIKCLSDIFCPVWE